MVRCDFFKKEFSVIFVFLFISIALLPSINQSVLKAINNDDLVEVTTQACDIEIMSVKRGTVKIHFYEDLDNDSVFDSNEPSPPLFIVHLKTQDSKPGPMINRIKIIGCRGNVIFRFMPYPAMYSLTAHYERVLYGILWEFWQYNGLLNLNEDIMGTQINLPISHFVVP